jgi:hypothetical protein
MNLCYSESIWEISLIFCFVEKSHHSGQAEESIHTNDDTTRNLGALCRATPNDVEQIGGQQTQNLFNKVIRLNAPLYNKYFELSNSRQFWNPNFANSEGAISVVLSPSDLGPNTLYNIEL